MNQDIKIFVVTCDLSQRVKHVNLKMEEELNFIKADKPRKLVTVDFYGPFTTIIWRGRICFCIIKCTFNECKNLSH